MTQHCVVQLTANFERNLAELEQFLIDSDATNAFDLVLDEMLNQVIPNLERFPEMGRSFFAHPTRSINVENALAVLKAKLKGVDAHNIREYLMPDYLLLYAIVGDTVYLISIRHFRQLSFDFGSLWADFPG